MKFLNILIIIFISLTSSIKADFNENFKNNNKENGKLILIRHAYSMVFKTVILAKKHKNGSSMKALILIFMIIV